MSNATPTLLQLIEQTTALNAQRPAVLFDGGQLTYLQMLMQSKGLGQIVHAQTRQPVVALFLPMSHAFVTTFFGVLYAGKTVLPLNMLLDPETLVAILKDSGADLVITIKLFKSRLEKLPVKVVALEELTPPASMQAIPAPSSEDVATLLYTSGTTGMPKGVELTHGNLASNAQESIQAMNISPDLRVVACLPTFHTFAITATMLAPLIAGGSLFAVPKFDPEQVLKVASEARCNTLMMVASMYRLVIRQQERKPYPLQLTLAITGGEACPADTREKFKEVFGIPLLEGYGQTESSPVISFNQANAHKPGTVGRPIPGVAVKIVDPETLQELPAGAIGEIWTKGPHVMRGYRNRPEETAKVKTPDGWLRTGDMGRLDAENFIEITGRLREMIKVAGEMVFPAEVENVLLKHPAVFEAGVLGEKDPKRGESVKAFVAIAEGKSVNEDELLAFCREQLPTYKVPRTIEFRKELPKGPTGKVIRRLLQ